MSLLSGIKNIVSDIGNKITDTFGVDTLAGKLGSTISNVFPRSSAKGFIFPVGAGMNTQQTLKAEDKLGLSRNTNNLSPYVVSGVPLSSQSAFTPRNIPTTVQSVSGIALGGSTDQKQETDTFIESGGAGQTNQTNLPIPTGLEEPTTEQSSQQLGGGLSGGSQSSLKSTLFSSPVRSSGTPNTYSALGNISSAFQEGNKSLVRFAGSPDIFDAETGTRLTYEEALSRGAFESGMVKDISSARPGIQAETDFQRFSGSNLNSEELSKINTPVAVDTSTSEFLEKAASGETEKEFNDLRSTIQKMLEFGTATEKQFDDAVKSANEERLKAQADIKALELNDIGEINDIVNDPDFSKRLKARRLDFMNDPQNPKWLLRLELNQKLQIAESRRSNAIEEYNLSSQRNQDNFNRAMQALNAMKPDSLGLKTDSGGNLWNLDRDPLSGKVSKVLVAEGFEKQKAYEDYTIKEINGRQVAILIGKDGKITQQDLGPITQKTGTGTGVAGAGNMQAAIAKLPVSLRDKVIDSQTLLGQIQQVKDIYAKNNNSLPGVSGTFGVGGSLSQFLTSQLGMGIEGQETRNLIGNLRGSIAKLRGGTSFTANEEALLNTYSPTINESDASIISKLSSLEQYYTSQINNTLGIAPQQNQNQTGSFKVTAPNEKTYEFSTQAQADEFKRKAGL